jgi:hypothetical protein
LISSSLTCCFAARAHIDGRFTHNALLRHQRSQLVGFAFEHKIGTRNGIDQLLSGQLVTQRLRVLIGVIPI